MFQGEAAIPTVYHGPAGTGAHGDVEFMPDRRARPRDAGLPGDAAAPVGGVSAAPSYDELRASFRWQLPAVVNIGVEVSDRQPPAAPAILVTDGREITRTVSFGELTEASNRLANALVAKGVVAGDRVALILSQRPETVIAHVAIYKLGAIVVPLSAAFGSDALGVRLRGSEPRAIIAERASLERAAELGFDGILIDVDHDLDALLAAASPDFTAAATTPDTPALLVYTSGTTGSPKGALHGHRVLAGHLPGFELSHDFFPQPGDRIWTPADWAWIGGLYDVVMPGLAHGVPVVAFRTPRFDPEVAFDVIAHAGIRNVFMPATALRMMRRSDGVPVTLRTIASGGETVGEETAAWCRERFGVRLNEFYGQTEANLLIGNCAAWPERPGWMGRAYPGHELRLVDGEIAVKVEGDPVVFLGYWRDEAATHGEGARRLAPHGRPGRGRRGGQLPQRRPGRRPHLERGPSHRPGRDRGVPHPPSVGVDRRRDRRARPDPRRAGEGVRRHECGHRRLARARDRAPAARPHPAGAVRGAAGDRVRRRAAAHRDREDPPRQSCETERPAQSAGDGA